MKNNFGFMFAVKNFMKVVGIDFLLRCDFDLKKLPVNTTLLLTIPLFGIADMCCLKINP